MDFSNMIKIQGNMKLPPQPTHHDSQIDFDKRMTKRAITLSAFALTEPEHYRPFGAVVVRNADRKLLSECVSDVGKSKDPSAHAELLAIRDACKFLGKEKLTECTLYTSCEPCAMCTALIYDVNLSRVVYACAWRDIADVIDIEPQFEEVAKDIHARAVPAAQLDCRDAVNTIYSFYQESDDDDE